MIDRYEPGDEHTGMTKSDTYEDHLAELAEMAKEIESLKAKLESKKWEIQVLDGEIKRLKDISIKEDGIPLPAGSILPLFL